MSTIGERTREVRLEMRLSQSKFGEIFGVGKSYISAVELDRTKLSVDNLVKLLVDYNVSVDYILGGIGSPFLNKNNDNLTDNEFKMKVLNILKEQGLIK